MRSLADDFSFPVFLSDRADDEVLRHLTVNIDAHFNPAQILGIQFSSPMEPALLADREQERDRRVRQVVLDQGLGQHNKHRASGPVVAAQSGRAIGDDAIALPPRPGASAKRYRVKMRREEKPRTRRCSFEINDEIARFRRQRDAIVRVVEPNCGLRDARGVSALATACAIWRSLPVTPSTDSNAIR